MKSNLKSVFSTKQLKKYSKNKIVVGAVALSAILVLVFYFWPSNQFTGEDFVVKAGDLAQTVQVTGTVKPVSEVDLAFENSGKVASVPFKVGDHVVLGQTLASLDITALLSDLRIAKANLNLALVDTANDEFSLTDIKNKQNTLVESAYRTLLSSDLEAVPSSSVYTMTPPVISGSFNGAEKGEYKIIIESDGNANRDTEIRTFGLEKTAPLEISKTEPTPLGTKGLFISFPDDLNDYNNTIWYVSIPNITSSTYGANLNAYEQALRTRDLEIAEAEKTLISRGENKVSDLEIEKSRADIIKIEAEIASKILRAPFAGVVTRQDAKVGQIATAGTVLVSLISDNNFEIEANMPEISVGNVLVGNPVKINFDALPGEDFTGKVGYIEPGETLVDGVVNYKIKIAIDSADARLKSGMTANLTIDTSTKTGVVSVPETALFFEDDKTFVYKKSGSSVVKTEVTVGLRGDGGLVEIISGVSAGDVIKTL
jgi:multidrug efflux pump subunit AcrA (membrane-fusion protein)